VQSTQLEVQKIEINYKKVQDPQCNLKNIFVFKLSWNTISIILKIELELLNIVFDKST